MLCLWLRLYFAQYGDRFWNCYNNLGLNFFLLWMFNFNDMMWKNNVCMAPCQIPEMPLWTQRAATVPSPPHLIQTFILKNITSLLENENSTTWCFWHHVTYWMLIWMSLLCNENNSTPPFLTELQVYQITRLRWGRCCGHGRSRGEMLNSWQRNFKKQRKQAWQAWGCASFTTLGRRSKLHYLVWGRHTPTPL